MSSETALPGAAEPGSQATAGRPGVAIAEQRGIDEARQGVTKGLFESILGGSWDLVNKVLSNFLRWGVRQV